MHKVTHYLSSVKEMNALIFNSLNTDNLSNVLTPLSKTWRNYFYMLLLLKLQHIELLIYDLPDARFLTPNFFEQIDIHFLQMTEAEFGF